MKFGWTAPWDRFVGTGPPLSRIAPGFWLTRASKAAAVWSICGELM